MKQSNIHPIGKRAIIGIAMLFIVIQLSAQPDSIANRPQFLYPEFSRSIVKLKSGDSHAAMMNYNTVTGKMIYYQDGVLLDLVKPESVDTIFMQNSKFVFNENEFYELLVNAPISLFIEHKSNVTAEGKPAAYGASSETTSSTAISQVYTDQSYNFKLPEDIKLIHTPANWLRINNVMYKFSSERQFLKLFPTKAAEIKKYIKQTDINFKRSNDLIKLVTYCNKLNM